MSRKTVIIYGIAGSVARQALEVISLLKYQLIGFAYHNSSDFIASLIKADPNIKYYSPISESNATLDDLLNLRADIYINAVSGLDGILYTYETLSRGYSLYLANKESIIVDYPRIKQYINNIIPLDSEHSALYSLLTLANKKAIKSYFITMSGGALRDVKREEYKNYKIDDILKHPTWKMGKIITIDSCSHVNKMYELLEAYYLFNIPLEKLNVYLSLDSSIHAGVEFLDTSIADNVLNSYDISHLKDKDEVIEYVKYPPSMVVAIKEALTDNQYSSSRFLASKQALIDNSSFYYYDFNKDPVMLHTKKFLNNFEKTKKFILDKQIIDQLLIDGVINYGEYYHRLLILLEGSKVWP